MNKKEDIKEHLIDHISNNPKNFPFISRFWDIELLKQNNIETEYIEFGYHGTKLDNSTPFYKPFSKIIELTKI
jgi:hypothetical protein